MGASVVLSWYGGSPSEPLSRHFGYEARNAASFSKADLQSATLGLTPLSRLGIGSSYSYVQQFALEVLAPAVPPSTLSHATLALAATLPAGSRLFFRGNPTYLDQTAGSAGPANVGVEDVGFPVTPPGYTIATTIPFEWDAMGEVGNGGIVGRVSIFLDLVLGLSSTFVFSKEAAKLSPPPPPLPGISHTTVQPTVFTPEGDLVAAGPPSDFIGFGSLVSYIESN